MSKTISIRIESRTTTATTKEKNHALRLGKIPAYVDQSRTELNSEILPWTTTPELKKKCFALRLEKFENEPNAKNKPQKMRKDAAISFSGIITFGTEAHPELEKLTPEEQDKRFLETAKNIADYLNTDLEGLTVHRDESALHAHFQITGIDKKGFPLSKKIKKSDLSNLQDIGAKPFNDLGIMRGKRIGQRIADGEDYSKTIHRSVTELHRDLPLEIEEQRKKLEQQRQREATTNEKIAQAEAKLASREGDLEKTEQERAKLLKRLKTYQNRVKKEQEELKRLLSVADGMPDIEKVVIQKEKKGIFSKAETEERTMIDSEAAKTWEGKILLQNKKFKEEAEQSVLEAQQGRELKSLILHNTLRVIPSDEHENAVKLAKSEPFVKYGVIMRETPHSIKIETQKASAKQKAAALWVSAKKKWPLSNDILANVYSDDTAKELIKMAIKDGMLNKLSFKNPTHQKYINDLNLDSSRAITDFKAAEPNKKPNLSPPKI